MLLMCKDKPVYIIETEEVLNDGLLPGCMIENAAGAAFRNWMKKRYSSGTNTLARQLRGVTFGQGNRIQIDKTTRALSLSDCYWLRDESDDITFENVSPYYTGFWNGEVDYKGGAIPTLYVPGYVSKAWINRCYLYKTGCEIEIECSAVCLELGIARAEVTRYKDGILVKNITSPDYMLEQADMSGRFDDENYTDDDIIREFGADGYKMILTDAVFGNGDRHLGNFGYMRDTGTGIYTGMAPLYDFDHALDAKGENDILIKNAVRFAGNNIQFREIAENITNMIIGMDCNYIFKMRAAKILDDL